MVLSTIMQYVSTVGGLGAIGVICRGAYFAVVDKRDKVVKTKIAAQAGEVDALTKLLAATPAEVNRLHARLAESEARATTLEAQLKAAHNEIKAMEGAMQQLNIQLSKALMRLNEQEDGNGSR